MRTTGHEACCTYGLLMHQGSLVDWSGHIAELDKANTDTSGLTARSHRVGKVYRGDKTVGREAMYSDCWPMIKRNTA